MMYSEAYICGLYKGREDMGRDGASLWLTQSSKTDEQYSIGGTQPHMLMGIVVWGCR